MATVEIWVLWVVVGLLGSFMFLIGWAMARNRQRKAEAKLKRIKPVFDISPCVIPNEPHNVFYIKTRGGQWNSDYAEYGEGQVLIEEIVGFRKTRKYPVARDDIIQVGPLLFKGKRAFELLVNKTIADLNAKVAHLETELSNARTTMDMRVHDPEAIIEKHSKAVGHLVQSIKDLIPKEKKQQGAKK
jgi:hypothetical protein